MGTTRWSKDIGNKDFYNHYKETEIRKGRKPLEYKLYTKILRDFNMKLRDKVLYEREIVNLPFRLGRLYIRKFEHTYWEKNKRLWNIDFKATKEQGRTVYHEAKFGYKWQWYKKSCIVRGRKWHVFRACRKSNRLIADAIKNKNLDYFEKQC